MTKKWNKSSLERIEIGIKRYFSGVLACAKHALISPLVAPGKANQFLCGVLALNDQIGYSSNEIPEKPLWELFPEICEEDCHIGRIFPRDGSNILPIEMLCMAAIVKHLAPRTAFEIGTSMGVTSYNIALNLPQDGKLYTLDLPPVDPGDEKIDTKFSVSISDRKMIFSNRKSRRFEQTSIADKISQLYGDSATFDYSAFNELCEFVFIDGSHAYDYVKSDTENALRIAKSGAWILWHDFTDGHFWPGVCKYLHEISDRIKIYRIQGTTIAIAKKP